MTTIHIYHYDAFTNTPHKGNPAGVVLNGDTLTDTDMQLIATAVGFNETAFPVHSTVADLRIRFFTPGHEMNLCGHATMATIYALKTRGYLHDVTTLTIETNAGILPITIEERTNGIYITMQHAAPQFESFNGNTALLAQSLGLHDTDIADTLPIVYGSTGVWTLLVPIKGLEAFQRMSPVNAQFPSILTDMPKASVHPFCLETYDDTAHMHARHFSSPYSGTIEDAVTGTASGVMGAYYANYINLDVSALSLTVEQGQEIGKDGRVYVHMKRTPENMLIQITGTAVYVKEWTIELANLCK